MWCRLFRALSTLHADTSQCVQPAESKSFEKNKNMSGKTKQNKAKPQQKRTRLDRSSPMRADLGKKITISQALHVDISGDFCAMTCDWSRKYALDTRNYYKTSMPSIHSNDLIRLHL